MVACANRALQKFICVDSDDEIWLTLLKGYAPCVFTISQDVILGIKYREWYKRLATCKMPSSSGACVDDGDTIEIRDKLRSQLLSMGEDGEFPPLAPPSLSPSDILIVVEVFLPKSKQRNIVDLIDNRFISMSFPGSDIDSFLNGHQGCGSIFRGGAYKERLFELTGTDIEVISEDKLHIRSKVKMVRLTDYKVICVHDVECQNSEIRSTFEFKQNGNDLDTSPTLLNVRVGAIDNPFASVQVDLTVALISEQRELVIIIEASAKLQAGGYPNELTLFGHHDRRLSGVTLLHFIEDFFDRP
eukprot:CAMPEP_0196822956 /NCGR_PEP_ID=MMETSP1362-20130617/85491_1 /TAXON_ID=163516 /ORGANISM="Leptocylindrus danicus, Strain CCMP1856" /LENGTH=300 /DNA_ID=CAMNT_0042202663 /DNA_START=427 /DNA_END=1329 /DNA_ORIENTATION=+